MLRAIGWLALLLVVVRIGAGIVGSLLVSSTDEFNQKPSETREYQTIVRHLREPFSGYERHDVIVRQFSVVALSNMATGFMQVYRAEPGLRDELLSLLGEVATRATSAKISPMKKDISTTTTIDDHNLYWSHLGIVLGARRSVRCDFQPCAASDDLDLLQEQIAQHLRHRTLQSPLAHAPSYPKSSMWPADQTATLAALKPHDVTTGRHLSEEPIAAFLRVMETHREQATGLFHSSVSDLSYAKAPRGCALSWSTYYLAQFAPDVAQQQYRAYRANYWREWGGIGGFREWPLHHDEGMDVDSGPIVFGLGLAATGIGLGASRMAGDTRAYLTIRRGVLAAGMPAWRAGRGYITSPLLGEAILFSGRTARPWFREPEAQDMDSPAFPLASVLLVIGVTVTCLWMAYRLWQAVLACRRRA